jgi:hypothetical protein
MGFPLWAGYNAKWSAYTNRSVVDGISVPETSGSGGQQLVLFDLATAVMRASSRTGRQKAQACRF